MMSMTVHDLECPNCGASVEFAGSTRATCAFCKSSLRLTGDGVHSAEVDQKSSVQPPPPVPAVPLRPLFDMTRRKPLPRLLQVGCLFVIVSQILFVCVCGSFVALANNVLLRVWGPLDQVAIIVQAQPEVVRALGQSIRLGSPNSSNFQSKNGSTTVKFNAPLIGATASGKVQVEGRWQEDGWNLDIWVTYPDDEGERQIFIQRRGIR